MSLRHVSNGSRPRERVRSGALGQSCWQCLVVAAAVAGCASEIETPVPDAFGDSGGTAGSGASGGTASGGTASGLGGSTPITGGSSSGGGGSTPITGGSGGMAGAGDGNETCAAQKARAELLPVRLSYAFDVSGSMGELDYPWHDPALKWDPILAATRAFFEDPESEGIEASLTLFPIGGDDWVAKCDGASYASPDVPMTSLPSAAFGVALESAVATAWGEGTPTRAVVSGVLSQIAESIAAEPGSDALVLVTDGYPQGCEDNSIESVVEVVAAVADEIPTYVIGVANPPLTDAEGNAAPETVMNLGAVAAAGGTERAYIIDTGDPIATKAAFGEAIEEIRRASIACNFEIPAIPDGRTFERDKVAVTYKSGTSVNELDYDASCSAPGAWRYDDPGAPAEIVLCDATCADLQNDRAAVIDVTFTCESIIDPH